MPDLLRERPGVICRLASESSRLGGGGKELVKALRLALGGKMAPCSNSAADERNAATASAFARGALAVGAAGAEGDAARGGDGGGLPIGNLGARLVQRDRA